MSPLLKPVLALALILALLAVWFLWSVDQKGQSMTAALVPASFRSAVLIEIETHDAVGAGIYQIDQSEMRGFVKTSPFLDFNNAQRANLRLKSYDENVYESGISAAKIDFVLSWAWCGKFYPEAARWLAQSGNYFQYYFENDAGLAVVNPKLNKVIACWYRV